MFKGMIHYRSGPRSPLYLPSRKTTPRSHSCAARSPARAITIYATRSKTNSGSIYRTATAAAAAAISVPLPRLMRVLARALRNQRRARDASST